MACIKKNDELDVYLKYLDVYGFANVPGFFDVGAIKKISKEAISILGSELKKNTEINVIPPRNPHELRAYEHVAYLNSTQAISSSLLGKSAIIDELMREIFSDERFNRFCAAIVGERYRIYTLAIRHLTDKSHSLGLHQDDFGTVTLSIPLNDVNADMPTTVFVPKSHKWVVNVSNKLFPFSLRFFKSFITPHVARVGDLGIFFNKTCHGVQSGPRASTVILIALVAEDGCKYAPWKLPEKTTYGRDFREMVGENLHSKLGSTHSLLQVDGQTYTTSTLPFKEEYGGVRTVSLHQGFEGRKIMVLPAALRGKLLVSKAMTEVDSSLGNLFLNGYFACMVGVSSAYFSLSKLRKLMRALSIHLLK